ncbi:MAG: hypothetical protein ABI867_22950 [Kofleriaceae bacterium]
MLASSAARCCTSRSPDTRLPGCELSDITPSNKDEAAATAEAVFNAAGVFKGKTKTAKLPKDLVGYLKGRKPEYAATKVGNEWTWAGTSAGKLRKVGAFWVAIEVPKANDGVFATILTTDWE